VEHGPHGERQEACRGLGHVPRRQAVGAHAELLLEGHLVHGEEEERVHEGKEDPLDVDGEDGGEAGENEALVVAQLKPHQSRQHAYAPVQVELLPVPEGSFADGPLPREEHLHLRGPGEHVARARVLHERGRLSARRLGAGECSTARGRVSEDPRPPFTHIHLAIDARVHEPVGRVVGRRALEREGALKVGRGALHRARIDGLALVEEEEVVKRVEHLRGGLMD